MTGQEPAPARYQPRLEPDPERQRRVGHLVLRVRYAESDRMGIVYNAHYLTWFEIGRTELLRSAGMPYRAVEERGINLPLVETRFRLRAPVRYDDEIEVETWIDHLRSRTIHFAYRILHGSDVVAEGFTTHACVDAEANRAVPFPAWLRAAVEALMTP